MLEHLDKKVAQLCKEISTLKQENRTLKSQLGDYWAESKHLKQKPGVDVSTQMCSAEPLKTASDSDKLGASPPPPASTHGDLTNAKPPPAVPEHSVAEDRSPGRGGDGTSVEGVETGSAVGTAPSPAACPADCVTAPPGPNPSSAPPCFPLEASTNPKEHQGSSALDDHPSPVYNVPVGNYFAVLTDGEQSVGEPREWNSQQTKISGFNQEKYTEREEQIIKRSPKDILSSVTVNDHATALLIGDSVLKQLNPRRLGLRSYHLLKI